jgi:hypothetical protein
MKNWDVNELKECAKRAAQTVEFEAMQRGCSDLDNIAFLFELAGETIREQDGKLHFSRACCWALKEAIRGLKAIGMESLVGVKEEINQILAPVFEAVRGDVRNEPLPGPGVYRDKGNANDVSKTPSGGGFFGKEGLCKLHRKREAE